MRGFQEVSEGSVTMPAPPDPTAAWPGPRRWPGGAAVLLHLRDPHEQGSYGFCPFLALTGHPCPGLRGLRAVNDLTHGDVVGRPQQQPAGRRAAGRSDRSSGRSGRPDEPGGTTPMLVIERPCAGPRASSWPWCSGSSATPRGAPGSPLTSGRDRLAPERAVRVRGGERRDRVGHDQAHQERDGSGDQHQNAEQREQQRSRRRCC